ncbi:MAG: 1-deoxy-D-xylulose-5-phosphate synthase [Clostridia bacterium]|nr:1-deoxy-D-xylulose-5-phosphate synthase [Clostridia bacterium]
MEKYPLIARAEDRDALKKMNKDELLPLCSEIREFLIEKVTENGGHLGSNLGVVELTVALHRVFDFPNDHLIFDVGHQSYTHKILTGRRGGFDKLRQRGGMSGFTKREESEFDCFGAGHSSTSVSAAIGFAEAERMNGSDKYTVAVLGDGAFTGGMVHEALNNCRRDLKLIIILNENEMSISKNTGAFASLIAKIRASKNYYKNKRRTVKIIKKIPLIGKGLFALIKRIKKGFKNKLYKSNYFEDLGLYYLGPADGNDMTRVERLLNEAKNASQSTVIHLRTVKGRGYMPAEKDPGAFHSVSPKGTEKVKNFSSRMGEVLTELASENEKICAVTAAMASGTGLVGFQKAHSDRFFDVGIAEEHALTFCAGLAANGYKPYFAVYSSFLQRGYDNLIHDIALQNLPVTVLVDRAGISEGDGATHHGIFDVSFLMQIPNMSVYAPASFESLERIMKDTQGVQSPVAIRYANCGDIKEFSGFTPISDFVYKNFENDCRTVIITYGRIVSEAVKAASKLPSCGVVLIEQLKPMKPICDVLNSIIPNGVKNVIFLEEGIKNGGAGMVLGQDISLPDDCRYIHLGIDDVFDTPLSTGNIYSDFGIGADDIIGAINKK